MSDHETWISPLSTRYASEGMRRNFSDATRHRHWRRLWLALAETEQELGLAITDEQLDAIRANLDDIDYEDEVRIACEERVSLSPDALTGMEQNLRFAGPETMETKIFGRLSAWQNWIFIRPNAVGPQGALKSFGSPHQAVYDFNRT